MALPTDESDAALESIDFLASSGNRVLVLSTLADGPMERRELEGTTGIPRPTISRVLEDFTSRGWVSASDRRYELTQLGAYVTTEFTAFLARMRVGATLGDVVEWLPEKPFDFDLACLTSAEVVRPRKTDASAPTTRIVRRLEGADRVRVLTYTLLPEAFRVCREKTVAGDQEVAVVFDPETVATMSADARTVDQAREMLETGRVSFYASDRPIPYVLVVTDDEAVVICLTGHDGVPRAVIDTDDETVRSWAESEFESYRTDATPLERSTFVG